MGGDVTSTGTSISQTLEGTTTAASASAELTFPVRINLAVTATKDNLYLDYLGHCKIVINSTTASLEVGNEAMRKENTQTLRFIVAPHGQRCESNDGNLTVTGEKYLAPQCPMLKTIVWGSTDNWAESPACTG